MYESITEKWIGDPILSMRAAPLGPQILDTMRARMVQEEKSQGNQVAFTLSDNWALQQERVLQYV